MVDRGTFWDIDSAIANNGLNFVSRQVRSLAPWQKSRLLPSAWQPNNWTVICGKGRDAFNHIGNLRFRILCEINKDKYEQATTKTEKASVVLSILDAVRDGSGCGGFVRQDPFTKQWFEVSTAVAREKVGQQLRDYSSKNPKSRQISPLKAFTTTAKRSRPQQQPPRDLPAPEPEECKSEYTAMPPKFVPDGCSSLSFIFPETLPSLVDKSVLPDMAWSESSLIPLPDVATSLAESVRPDLPLSQTSAVFPSPVLS